MDAVNRQYSAEEALQLLLENLRKTHPDKAVQLVIDEIEEESRSTASSSTKSSRGRRVRKSRTAV